MSRIRSLLLTQGFPPPFTGGSEVYLYNIFRRFPPGEVTIFTEVSREPNPQDTATGIRFVRRSYIRPGLQRPITKLEKLRMRLLWTMESMYLCWRDRPDCVYVETYWAGVLALLAKSLFCIPYIALVYGEEVSTLRAYGGSRRRIMEAILRNAHRVVTISNFTIDQLVRIGMDRERIVLIPPAADPSRFDPNLDVTDLRARLGLDGCKVVVTVGRLTNRKGHAWVISALPRVLQVVPNLTYLIVGQDMGTGKNLRDLVKRLGLEKYVIFVGPVDPADLPKYYCICDVFVMANYELDNRDTEGFGIVFLEANSCGKPVIGGRAGGVQDAIVDGETGLVVDPTDVDSLSGALIKLLTDEEYARRLGSNGRKRVLECFSWETAASAVRELGLAAAHNRKGAD